MKETCKATNITLSALMHIFILFAVLCTLFILVISKVERSKFREEINAITTDKLVPALKQHRDPRIDVILKRLDLDRIKAYYAKESDKVKISNEWMVITMVIINVFLFLLILAINVLARKCVHIGHLILENAIVFIFVGIFEFLFFKNIASKYVPVHPSEFQKLVIKNLWV